MRSIWAHLFYLHRYLLLIYIWILENKSNKDKENFMIQWTNIEDELPEEGTEVIVEYDDKYGSRPKTIASYVKNNFIDKKTAKAISYVKRWSSTEDEKEDKQKIKIMKMINESVETKQNKYNDGWLLLIQKLIDTNIRLNSIISDNNEMIQDLQLNGDLNNDTSR